MPLRSTILWLSRNQAVRNWMETSRAARSLSARFVAGNRLENAIEAGRRMLGEGIKVTLDYLGENVKSLEEAAACRDTCIGALSAMRTAGIEPNVSIKLTQFGLDLSEEECEANVSELVKA